MIREAGPQGREPGEPFSWRAGKHWSQSKHEWISPGLQSPRDPSVQSSPSSANVVLLAVAHVRKKMDFSNTSPESHCISELLDSSDGEEEEILMYGEDLELNPFDGLPYSSRYYKLMKERRELPVWKVRCAFMESLLHHQIVIVSGDAKTGKSSQVSMRKCSAGFLSLERWLLHT